jgi:hypothetical protein
MKTLIGYYDKDGNYVGKKLDSAKRKKYIIAIGTLRRKIAEHNNQSPYKDHEILPYSKNYCDKTRMLIQYDVYENGRKQKEVKTIRYWYGDDNKPEYRTYNRIGEHLQHNIRRMADMTGLSRIFLPNGHDINLDERR